MGIKLCIGFGLLCIGFDLLLVLFKLKSYFVLIRNCHVTH